MFVPNHKRTLIIGIGNASRGDDALGWAFIDRFKERFNFQGDLEYRYQLQIEDADLICNYDQVIFVDATKTDLTKGFEFASCPPEADFTFSTHAISPGSIMALARELYSERMPEAFILQISGYQWDLDQGMSEKAEKYLELALENCELGGTTPGEREVFKTQKTQTHA